METKKSTITELNLQNEKFNDMYIFTIAFENGDIGKLYKKKDKTYEQVGDEVEYTLSPKGTVKIAFKGQSKFDDNNTKTTVNYVNNDVSSQDIIRHAQAMNLAEQRYCFDKINHTEIDKVTKEIYFKLKNFNGYKENEVEQKVEVDNDMPF
jgi:sorbitol-specific phosphotransferase system component IIA